MAMMKQKVGGPALGEIETPLAEEHKSFAERAKGFAQEIGGFTSNFFSRAADIGHPKTKGEIVDKAEQIGEQRGARNAWLWGSVEKGAATVAGYFIAGAVAGPVGAGAVGAFGAIVTGLDAAKTIYAHSRVSGAMGEELKELRKEALKSAPD